MRTRMSDYIVQCFDFSYSVYTFNASHATVYKNSAFVNPSATHSLAHAQTRLVIELVQKGISIPA